MDVSIFAYARLRKKNLKKNYFALDFLKTFTSMRKLRDTEL